MNAEHLSALRQAATALINTAPAPTVLAALQALLADPAFAADAPVLPRRPAQSAPESAIARTPVLPVLRPARDKPTARANAAAAPSDPEWDVLRSSVRQAMAARGLDFAGLGQAIRRSEIAVRIALGSRKPARPVVQTRLREWLTNGAAGAPEVAAQPIPFRRSRSGAYVDGSVYADNAAD